MSGADDALPGAVAAGDCAAALSPSPWRSLAALAGRECLRVARIWTQTMLAPVISSILFIVVFGLSLGSRISGIGTVPYDVFIVPGLAAMAMAQAAYSNNSSSIFQARSDRYIHDVLAAPMHPWQMNLGYSVGGAFRALVIGAVVVAVAIPVTGISIERPLALIGAVTLLIVLFGALGTVVGIYAESFDHHSFINNIVILPLTFVGGVFYSIDVLPSPWEEISHANPIFYMVNAVRYGFLGISEVSVALSFAITAALATAVVAWSQWLFVSGRKLKA